MHRAGRPGHGERGRVAARTRALFGEPHPPDPPPAAGTGWLPGSLFGDERTDPVPPTTSGPRWRSERRAVLAIAGVVAAVAAATLWWVLSARPSEVDIRAVAATPTVGRTGPGGALGSPLTSASPAAVRSAPTARPDVVVDVAGKVKRPGVYRLPEGSRVIDAVQAAGGALPGASTVALNLAALLQDGQQVAVDLPGAAVVAAAGPGPAAGPVNLNTATLEQLETLPGVGPVLAQNILDWRTQHGRFTRVSQLDEVTGVGEVTYASLRARVTV